MVEKKQESDTKTEENLKYKAKVYSIKEGIFASAKGALADNYISPFAIAINMSSSLVVLLSSISGLLGPLSQIFGSRLIEKHSRKKIILRAVLGEFLWLIPFITIAYLFYKGIIINILPLLFLLSFSFYVIFANMGSPAWFSWVGDLVNEKRRGRWFSKRNFILGFVSVVLALGASFFLDYFKQRNWTMFGFIILFSLAIILRFNSWRIFKKQYEPKIKLRKGYYFSFTEFLIKGRKTNFGKFAIFRAWLTFAMAIASPLFAVYLLRHLQFSYVVYMVIILAGTVFSLLVMQLWGVIADKYGNYKILIITSLLIPTIPILWIISSSPIYLIFVPTLISGVSWAGFNLASGNFVYDNVGKQKRGLAVSYFRMLIGIGTFLGAGLGAILIRYLSVDFIEPILLIFFISGIARMIIVAKFLPDLREIRKTEKFDGKRAFKNLIFKQFKHTLAEEVHEIRTINKYLKK